MNGSSLTTAEPQSLHERPMVSTKGLPVPVVHKGGFLYRMETTATLNGEPVPQTRQFTKPENTEDRSKEVYAMLEAATVGQAEYLVIEEPESGEPDEQISMYRKVAPGVWELSLVGTESEFETPRTMTLTGDQARVYAEKTGITMKDQFQVNVDEGLAAHRSGLKFRMEDQPDATIEAHLVAAPIERIDSKAGQADISDGEVESLRGAAMKAFHEAYYVDEGYPEAVAAQIRKIDQQAEGEVRIEATGTAPDLIRAGVPASMVHQHVAEHPEEVEAYINDTLGESFDW